MKRRISVLAAVALITTLTAAFAVPAAAAEWESGLAASPAAYAAPAQTAFSAPAYQSEALRLINQPPLRCLHNTESPTRWRAKISLTATHR